MDWERFDRWANRAQFPFTVGGYVGWAYMLWKGAVLFGSSRNVNWTAVAAVGGSVLGCLERCQSIGFVTLSEINARHVSAHVRHFNSVAGSAHG
jgi:hypothetical protein